MNGVLLAGRYRLQECIGRGGMGRVWRARDEVLHRFVAVKELTAALYAAERDRPVLLQRTRAEARAAARISHPAVVTVHDVLEHDERPWIVMELIDGGSFADAVQDRGRIEAEEAARTGLWVVRALRAAHDAGVVHRDVKPANVLLASDGRVLLTDFGIAQVDGDSGMTRTGEIVGSVDYLAPERVRGGEPGPASDLWALGATLYTAVEGVSPFRRPSALGTFQAVVDEEPAPPAHAGPLTPVITALLRKDPEARPAAEEVERMLEEAAEGRWPVETGPAAGYTPTRPVPPEVLAGLAAAPPPPGEPPAPTPPTSTPVPGDPAASSALAGAPTTSTPAPSTPLPQGPLPPSPLPPAPFPSTPAHPVVLPTTTVAPAPPAGRPRWYAYLAGAVAVVVLSVGGAVVLRYVDGGGRDDRTAASDRSVAPAATGSTAPGASASPSGASSGTPAGTLSKGPETPAAGPTGSTPDAGTSAPPAEGVPAGWVRVNDPGGFSLAVPQGWQRKTTRGQIDYTPDGGEHFLRIGVDPSPDFDSPYAHLLDLEKQLTRLTDYSRQQLVPQTFRDRPGARWEFSWVSGGSDTAPGPRRAVEQAYFSRDGVEYAIYMSGPEADWATTRAQFETVLGSWRENPDGT
ncbi:protein kinase [Streptomyces sp. NPDC059578]|uniref:serine/threonine-protein kinase n=1 Tax=unclassified Streptomyces TaxID=2593676 RepID=UPI00364C919D